MTLGWVLIVAGLASYVFLRLASEWTWRRDRGVRVGARGDRATSLLLNVAAHAGLLVAVAGAIVLVV